MAQSGEGEARSMTIRRRPLQPRPRTPLVQSQVAGCLPACLSPDAVPQMSNCIGFISTLRRAGNAQATWRQLWLATGRLESSTATAYEGLWSCDAGKLATQPPQVPRHSLRSLFCPEFPVKRSRLHQNIAIDQSDHGSMIISNLDDAIWRFSATIKRSVPIRSRQEPSGAAHRDQAIQARLHLPIRARCQGVRAEGARTSCGQEEQESEVHRGGRGGVAERRPPPRGAAPADAISRQSDAARNSRFLTFSHVFSRIFGLPKAHPMTTTKSVACSRPANDRYTMAHGEESAREDFWSEGHDDVKSGISSRRAPSEHATSRRAPPTQSGSPDYTLQPLRLYVRGGTQQSLMPRPALPPTPNSADINGKDGMAFQSSLEGSFALPPPALTSKRSSTMSSFPPPSLPESTRSEQSSSRRRASTTQSLPVKDDFTLPPPPTRSRKIIQMKPREKDLEDNSNSSNTKARRNSKSTVTTANESPKRKTPSSSSAAGRKMARKTAHSLIERRRRSKMNEEFGVLKDMIPACKDQEMHKLAILQASIDYLRYLEQCVHDLKKASASPNTHPHLVHPLNNPPPLRPSSTEDIKMEDSPPLSTPGPTSSPSHSQLTSPTGFSAHETPPALISPIYAASAVSDTISPALLPQHRHDDGPDLDREATHALMMLTNDRRGTTRGLSVKDLLSA